MRIRADAGGLEALSGRLEALAKGRAMDAAAAFAGERAAEVMRAHTPVSGGETGGALRDGWTIGRAEKSAGRRTVRLENGVPYASFVEHGHRQAEGQFVPAVGAVLVRGWVPGRHFQKAAEIELSTETGWAAQAAERALREI